MIDKEIIFKELIEGAINSSTMRKFVDGELVAIEGGVYINNEFLTYIPYEFNQEKIHGNRRNSLAKEFINTYTFKDLKTMYNNKVQEERKKTQFQNYNKYKLDNLYNVLCDLLSDVKNVKKDLSINYGINAYEIEISASKNSYSSYVIKIHLIYNSTDYSVYSNNERKNMTENEIIQEVKNIIPTLIEEQNRREKEKELKRIKENRHFNIETFVNKFYLDDKILILKKGKKFMAFNDNLRYSVGNNVRGKYYRCNRNTYINYINKGYTEYIQVDETYQLNTEKLLSMSWRKIA